MPDLAFVAWEQLPSKYVPKEPIADFAPRLAVEVLCTENTAQEMRLKLNEYFEAGVRLVWYVDPDTRTVEAYTGPDDVRRFSEEDTLDGAPLALSKSSASRERHRPECGATGSTPVDDAPGSPRISTEQAPLFPGFSLRLAELFRFVERKRPATMDGGNGRRKRKSQ
jgi:Uma2 family endonuclease